MSTPGSPQSSSSQHDPYAALREPNYRWFAGGWVVASMGLQMQATALGWEIYEKTHNALYLGLMGAARALPVVLLALPAGQVVDLLDRRRMLIFTQLAFFITSLVLAFGSFENVSVWWLYVLVALTGCARVFNGPSRASLLPTIVRRENFHNAVTWNSGVFQFSAILGPILAGVLIDLTGVAWPVYVATAASCVCMAFACTMLKPSTGETNGRIPGPRAETTSTAPPPPGRIAYNGGWSVIRPSVLAAGMLEGVRFVWREKAILGAITLDLFAVLLGGAEGLMPVFAKDILKVGAVGLGILNATPKVGALIMAFFIAHRRPFRHVGRALLLSVAGFGLCTIVFGLSTSIALSVAMLFILGALDNISVVIRSVLVTLRTPDHLRGRVTAVNSVFIESSNQLGSFESGLVASLFTPVISVVAGGIGTILVVLGIAIALPELRKLGDYEHKTPKPAPTS